MKKFVVKPRSFQKSPVNIGSSERALDEWAFIGRLSESGPLVDVHFDLGSEHVVAIFGKRGSGKSYTLGSLLESLCTLSQPSCISSIHRSRSILLFDTLGVFQWTDISLTDDSDREVIQKQFGLRLGWQMVPEELDVQVWVPAGTRTSTTPASHSEFAIRSADFNASDWGYLLNLDIMQDRMGQLLNDAYVKVTIEGWQDARGVAQGPRADYAISDLVRCVQSDTELASAYASETRRAVMQQLTTLDRNPLFQAEGTSLSELLRPGRLAVVVMSHLSDELRLVLVMSLIRKVLEARMRAAQNEKHLLVRSGLTDEESAALEAALLEAIPPTWVVVDEAQNVLPSERSTAATDTLVKFVREGRNFGLSFMFTTQQPTAVDQRILAQVDTVMAHKLTVQGDIEYVRKNMKCNLPEEIRFGNSNLSFDEVLRSLDIGQVLVSNTETERAFLMQVRPRLTVHGGF
jgi:hypothetical protein